MSRDWDRSMIDVDHDRPDGVSVVDAFRRGPQPIAADGGRREGADDRRRESAEAKRPPADTESESVSTEPAEQVETDRGVTTPLDEESTMRDVSHTPPTGDGTNEVFLRGTGELDESQGSDAAATGDADDTDTDEDV